MMNSNSFLDFLYRSVRWKPETSKLLCLVCNKQRQKKSVSNLQYTIHKSSFLYKLILFL